MTNAVRLCSSLLAAHSSKKTSTCLTLMVLSSSFLKTGTLPTFQHHTQNTAVTRWESHHFQTGDLHSKWPNSLCKDPGAAKCGLIKEWWLFSPGHPLAWKLWLICGHRYTKSKSKPWGHERSVLWNVQLSGCPYSRWRERLSAVCH